MWMMNVLSVIYLFVVKLRGSGSSVERVRPLYVADVERIKSLNVHFSLLVVFRSVCSLSDAGVSMSGREGETSYKLRPNSTRPMQTDGTITRSYDPRDLSVNHEGCIISDDLWLCASPEKDDPEDHCFFSDYICTFTRCLHL